MFDNVFRPLAPRPGPRYDRAHSDQHDGGLRSDAYPLQDHSAPQRLASQYDPSAQNQFAYGYQTSNIPIARKPIGSSLGFVNSGDRKGPYEHIGAVGPYHQRQQGGRLEFLRIWWLEFLCCILFVGALVAVIITIYPYEGRPLPQWRYHLSINSLISVYIVILKAAMLLVVGEGLSQLKWRWFGQDRPLRDLLSYDNASRGPWGSLKLLWTLRGRQLVSSCGAFITVAALIVDPFAQQVIATYDCKLPAESGLATIPRTNAFLESGAHIGAGTSTVTLEMQKSINAGVFNPGGSVTFDCATGNCTFPTEYHTVGYCSECNDTTNKLSVDSRAESTKTNDTSWTISLSADDSVAKQNLSLTMNASYHSSEYFVISRTDIIAGYLLTNQSKSCEDTCPSLTDSNYDKCNANWKDVRWGCAALPGGSYGGMSAGIGAASCSLQPCVRTYTAEVDGGRWKERLLSVAKEWGMISGIKISMVDVKCLNARDRTSLADAGYDFEGKLWIPYNITLDGSSGNFTSGSIDTSNVTKGAVSRECIYQFSAIAANSIENFLSGFLNGTITPGSYAYDYQGSAQMQAIYHNANVTFDQVADTYKNVSDSITTYIRQHGATNFSAPALGQAYVAQTCVHIRWPFLAYPAALVLLAIVFFISMVVETRRATSSRHDWKSSSLALLFHGLDRQAVSREELNESVRAREMEKIAEQTPVRLSETQNGWQFVRNRTG